MLRRRRVAPRVEVDFAGVAGIRVDGGARDGRGGGGLRVWLLVVQNSGQQGRSAFLPLLYLLVTSPASHYGRTRRWRPVADVVGVPPGLWERRSAVLVCEWEHVGWGGPASLFPISTLPPLLTGETGLRILPAAPPLQILQIIGGLQSEDFQVPVLVEQRGGTDEDEQTHPHDHRPGQFHPLSVAAASAPRRLWRGGYVTRHRNTHPHQNHHDTQQQPDARGGA